MGRFDGASTLSPYPHALFEDYGEMDMIVVKSLCGNNNVSRLQLNLVAANTLEN
ncbi:hypothetical protein M569_09622 [Genlisea aurea]|uniref:Uncharacterized protein n=1 Tax=Genlisea aurea TaxID=192259 RepID=S8DYP8_9LAMI|nr:hypothetical protein M569_09622 [Genlisea aurea]